MLKLTILGAAGRMGQSLIRAAASQQDLSLVAAAERPDHPALGVDAGTCAGIAPLGLKIAPLTAAVASDVVIDFTFHAAVPQNLAHALSTRQAYILGTTGLTPDEEAAVNAAATQIPIVWAPNMSLGVNLLLALVEQAATALRDKGFDIEIVERHHRRKKDAPSGTALALGAAAAAGAGLDLTQAGVHGRSGLTGERPERQIGFHAVRGGDIVGDHTVLFAADGECLELGHRATSRDAFALGALRAAAWVAGRGPGLYSMRDVLGI